MPFQKKPVAKFITARYLLAVFVMALFVTGSYLVLLWGIDTERRQLELVNLVQQQNAEIANSIYLANLTAYAPGPEQREAYRAELSRALDHVEERLKVLSLEKEAEDIPDETKDVLRGIYFGQPHLGDKMKEFLRRGDDMVAPGEDHDDLKELAEAYANILGAHVKLTGVLRDETAETFREIITLASVLWLLGLLVLAGKVFFIFRPMARRTVRLMEDMRRAREEARNEASAAVAAREGLASFVRTMNHELRTPLNAILGMAQLLRMRDLPAKEDEYARDIQKAGEHLLGLINDILDLSRLDAGQVKIRQAPVALGNLLERTATIMRPLAQQKHLDLTCRFDESLPGRYLADEGHIQQVLLNLIGNAIKFTEEGSIEVRAAPAGLAGPGIDRVRFEVEDTGIGVPANKREAIFEEFQQVDGRIARQTRGAGLGLAISRRLVNLMGGEIGLESAGSAGSRFWFTLPLERA